MKSNDIEQQLARRHDGSLGADELEELNRLCGRDEVFAAADRRVATLRRHRRVAAMAAVLAVAVGGMALLGTHGQEEPQLVASAEPLPVAIPAIEAAPAVEQPAAEPQPRPAKRPKPAATAAKPVADEGPVVVCNNQCDADSVISDIWKFLSA